MLILAAAFGLCSCSVKSAADTPVTGALTAPEYENELTGRIAVFKSGEYMLITENGEAIIISTEMNMTGLSNGDLLTMFCGETEETYPAKTTVCEMILLERGTAADLPAQVIENLSGLGFGLSE